MKDSDTTSSEESEEENQMGNPVLDENLPEEEVENDRVMMGMLKNYKVSQPKD